MKKGASLIWAVVLCGVLIFVVSTMALTTLSEMKLSSRIDDSARAYAAAQSGIEYGRNYLSTCAPAGNCVAYPSSYPTSGAKVVNISEPTGTAMFSVTVAQQASGGSTYLVKSLGTVNGVNRALEYTISVVGDQLQLMDPASIVSSASDYVNGDKFVFGNRAVIKFNYWHLSNSDHIVLGFSNDSSGTNSMDLHFMPSFTDGGGNHVNALVLEEKHSGIIQQKLVAEGLTVDSTRPGYNINLVYLKNISWSVTVLNRDPVTFQTSCFGSNNLDLISNGGKVDDMNNFYLSSASLDADLETIHLGAMGNLTDIYQSGISSAVSFVVNHLGGAAGSYTVKADGNVVATCDLTCFSNNTSKTYFVKKDSQIHIDFSPGVNTAGSLSQNDFNADEGVSTDLTFDLVKSTLSIGGALNSDYPGTVAVTFSLAVPTSDLPGGNRTQICNMVNSSSVCSYTISVSNFTATLAASASAPVIVMNPAWSDGTVSASRTATFSGFSNQSFSAAFGQLINCSLGGCSASFSSQSVPTTMIPGQAYSISVTMNNNGTKVWNFADSSHPFRLGTQNPQDNMSFGFNRVPIPAVVNPGSNVTFNFTVTAPSTVGTYNFQWKMVQDNYTWFGVSTTNQVITVTPPANDNFEAGNLNYWTKIGSPNYPVAVAGSVGDPVGYAISGAYSAYVRGTYPGAVGHTENDSYDGIMYKDFMLPTISTTKTLSFSVNSSIGSTSYDHNRIDIYNQTAGGTLIKEWSTSGYGAGGLTTATNVNYGGVASYSQTFDSTYSGKTIRIYFRSHCGGWDASMLIDDIVLN